MKEIPNTSGNHSVTGTDPGFIYKFVHSATMVCAIFAKKNNEEKQLHNLYRQAS